MINFWKIRGLLILLTVLAFTESFAQNFARHNWYFGNNVRGIRFSRSDNSATLVTNQFTPFGTGGSAVASDQTNANLLFYSDGSRVIDLTHRLMPNGGGLNANIAANQPVAICPIPGSTNQYLVFTNNANFTAGGNIAVTTVDLSLPGNAAALAPPLGNVTTKNVATGLTGRSEAMITVPHSNGTDYWLITHENGTDNYTVTLIGAGGTLTHNPVPNVTGFSISAANFSYHEATGKIAVSPQTANRNVAILDFDNSTGALTFDQFVLNSAVASTTTQAIYDTEWSLSGRFLYISTHGETGIPADVVQFDLQNPGNSLATVLPAAPFRSYGIQMAPDSAIYHLYQTSAVGPFLVGKLSDTDSLASNTVYTSDAFGGNLSFSGTQFPSFAPSTQFNLAVTFTSAGTCANSPVSFYPTVTPGADSLFWNFGDGQTSSEWSPVHTYAAGGGYNVSVTAFLNGQTAVGNGLVNLTQFDLQLTLVQDTTACKCEFPPPVGQSCNGGPFSVSVTTQGGSGTLTFLWSNGDTGPTLTPDSAGYYYVIVTDATGCSAYAGVNVREYDAIDQRANFWYFGQNAGIDFNQQPSVAVTGPVNTPEGCATISDRNGSVILSTDGVRVYNRNNVEVPIPVPPGIGGNQGATQSVIILPVPGDETLYYIFTTQEIYGTNTFELRYSLYDIKLNNGDGGLVQYNQLLFAPSTERITGNGNWLIAHEYGNNSFRAYPISGAGIGNPVISSIGSDHQISDAYNGQGYMKLGGNNKLAVALPTFGVSNVLEIFDFDNTTGILSNYQRVDLNSTAEQVYGVEFYGNKLFATLKGTPSYIREIYFDFQGNPVLIPPLVPPAGAINEELGALQTGPDGQLYVAVNNKPFLGAIIVNPDTLQLSSYLPNAYTLAGGTLSKLGLPNFAQQIGTGPMLASMLVTGFCLGTPTDFAGTGTDPIDEFEWSFGDGFGSTDQVTQHTYAAAGNYLVTLRVTNRCGLDTLITQNITISAPPANPTFLPIGQQPVLCNGNLTLEAEPAPGTAGYTYAWSTGETTRTIVVNQQSIINVTITSAQGCPTSGSILVADNRPIVDLGADLTICQNSAIASLNAQNPGLTYQWFLNEVANGNVTQTQTVNTTAAGVFEYKVQVRDAITTCIAKDSVVYTINTSPDFTAVTANTACGINNGQISLTINNPAGSLFSYLIVGTTSGTSLSGIDRPVGVIPAFTALPADTYIIQVADQISGCATTSAYNINNNAFTISSVARQNTCDPLVLRVTHTAAVTPYTFNVVDNSNGQVVQTGTSSSLGFFDTPGVPSGTYVIQITSGGCSFSSNPQTFNQDPKVAIAGFSVNGCTNPISVGVNGGTGWAWTGPNITSGTNSSTITATPPQGSQQYSVRVTGAGCPLDTLVTVFVNNNVLADFTQDDACQNQVTLTASANPAGSYTYRWYRSGVLVPGAQSIIIGTVDNGVNYRVEVLNALSGCVFTSADKQVFVAGDLQVAMTTTTPCTGTVFTLTANTTPANSGANFQWAFNGNNISGGTNATLQDSRAGLYKVTASLPGCEVFNEQQIILFPTPVGSLPDKELICNDPANNDPDTKEVLLDAGAGFISYQWYQGGVLSTNTTQTFLVTEPALYSVELENSYGCIGIDETLVEEECNARIIAPTAFRPKSSNTENNAFYLFTYFVAEDDFQLFIYNRWGELVHQSDGLENNIDPANNMEYKTSKKWNGGYQNNAGQLLPAGTYTYVVKYKSLYGGGVREQRGGVLLVR